MAPAKKSVSTKHVFTPTQPASGVPASGVPASGALATSNKPTSDALANKPASPPKLAKPPALDTLTSWSYSVYTQYMKCPLSVCFEKIKRIRIYEPPNPALEKGSTVHKFAENFIALPSKTEAPEIIPELAQVSKRLQTFRKLRARVEQDWAFTKDWLPTSWFGPQAWLRVKVDVCAETLKPKPLVHITDWKTGKIYDEHRQQRSLYALSGLQLVDVGVLVKGDKNVTVVAEHLYTDTTQSATETFTMKDLAPLKREWLSRIKQMMSDTKYPAKTGFHCRYCRYRKSNNGPCPEDM